MIDGGVGMKRKILKAMVCFMMILSCMMAPVSATTAAAASKAAYILRVNADYARMRTGPYGNYDIVTTLRKGTKVLYGGQYSGEFCKVYTTGGQSGYVYRKYLSSYGAVKKSNIYRTKSAAAFYTRSGSSLKKVGTVPKNQFVLIYKKNGNWAYVKSLTGKSGYMKLSTLKKVF